MQEINTILEKAALKDNTAPGDYIVDGIRHCARCRQAKQTWVKWLDGQQKLVSCSCKCSEEQFKREQEQEKQRQFELAMDRLNETYRLESDGYRRYTFSRDDGRSEKASWTCREYVRRWPDMLKNNVGILLYGRIGAGKSFYAGCIVNALRERRVSAVVTSLPRIINVIQSTRDAQGVIHALNQYKLLVVDDFGVESDSGYRYENVFNIFDSRNVAGLPVIVTTNYDLKEMETPAAMNDGRIFDRVLGMCPIRLPMLGESRRTDSAKRRREIALEVMGVTRRPQ